MKLYFFRSGYIHRRPYEAAETADTPFVQIPICCFFIQHEGRNILFDAGISSEYMGTVLSEKEKGMVLPEDEFLPYALRQKVNVKPEDVDILILSHLHVDHVGTAACFPNAIVMARETEFQFARSFSNPMETIYSAFQKLAPLDWFLIPDNSDYDVCGDGRIKLICTPGHTPGHQSLLVSTDNSGVLLLAADGCNSRFHLQTGMLPEELFCDKVAYQKTLQRLRAYEKAGVKIVFGHDREDWETYRKAPEFYS